jgi:hypothetical protein
MYKLQNNKICNNKSGGVTKVLNNKNNKYMYDLFIITVKIPLRTKNKKLIISKPCKKLVKIKTELK